MFYGKEKDMKYDNDFSGFLVYKKANEKKVILILIRSIL